MKFYSIIWFGIFLIIFSTNCNKEENPVGPDDTAAGYIYPLKVGNQWEYTRTLSAFNLRPIPLEKNQSMDTTVTTFITMKIIKKETGQNLNNTFIFQETNKVNNDKFICYSYYANLDSGLCCFAYQWSDISLPKTFFYNKILFGGRYFNNIGEIISYLTNAIPQNFIPADSLIYETPPLLSLKYPIKTGSQWTYRFPGKSCRIDKKIISFENVQVPAGNFNCYKIQWLYDKDNDNVWDDDIIFYDYICEKGLIKRSAFFENLIITGEQNPEPLALFSSKFELILTKLTL